MKALILAGGEGTRLKEITKGIPKPMVRIGNLPLIEHQINLLKEHNIKEVVVLTCYLSEIIEGYFKDGSDRGMHITYVKEESPLGTAGAIKKIENQLKEDFIVVYGDIMLEMDITRLLDFHNNKNSLCTLAVHPNNHPFDSDLIEIDDNQRIIAFHSKPHDENKYFRNLVSACLYVMSPLILGYVEKNLKADFGRDIFPKVIQKETLYAYNTAEYLKDIGTLERLADAERDYLSGKIEKYSRNNKRRAIFLDRDGVINKEVNLLHRIEDFIILPGTAKAIKKINDLGYLAIVITNQPVIARNLCSIEELEEIHKKMETLLGREGAKLDAIYYCPHHPDAGFPGENKEYKIKCDCRKPDVGLVRRANEYFNIDLANSYFIGDSFRDILCGKKVGAVTIGVNYKDSGTEPDYLFDDLEAAVDFIVDQEKIL